MSYRLKNKAKTQKGELTRQKLLNVAKETIGSKGYYNTSIVEITQKAGVAQGTFYIYFNSKKDIFRQLVIILNKTLRREIQKASSHAKNRKEKEKIGYKTFFSFIKNNQDFYNLVFEAQYVDEEIYRWYFKTLANGYIRGLQEAADREELRNLDPECLAYCLIGITAEVSRRWILWEDSEVPEHIFNDMVEFIFHGMVARE